MNEDSSRVKIGPGAGSWDEKTIKGAALMKEGAQVLDCTAVAHRKTFPVMDMHGSI